AGKCEKSCRKKRQNSIGFQLCSHIVIICFFCLVTELSGVSKLLGSEVNKYCRVFFAAFPAVLFTSALS
ncbi:MAG: hypothetical protein VCD00_01820, partial [Candidatus Hydrogenedentota bacterium]